MAKFENDLDLKKARSAALRVKATFFDRLDKDPSVLKILDKLTKNKSIQCFIFSKSIAFRIGRSSVKTIQGFASGFKSNFSGGDIAKKYFIPTKLPASSKKYSKSDVVFLCAVFYLLDYFDRVKSESDKTEAVESEQVLKVQNDLTKLIKEYGSVRLIVGKETYDVDNFSQVPGRPKADMVFTYKGRSVIFVSHKKGGAPAAFQQYGGFSADLGIKSKSDAKKYPEIYKFLDDIDTTLKALGVSKDREGRYDLNDLRKGSNMARMIYDENIANIVMFGKDFNTKRVGLDNCSILIDGDIVFKPKRLNTFELKGSFHTSINPVLQKTKKPYKANPNDVYSPVMFIIKSEQQGLKQAGLTNARAVIWPNNNVAQTYSKQFETMFNSAKSRNASRIKSIQEEYKK
jgi:hypothetical protein